MYDYTCADLKWSTTLKTKYNDAYEYFKKEIYFDGFMPTVRTSELFYIRNGFVSLMDGIDHRNEVAFVSIHRDPLKKVDEFLSKTGKISKHSVYPVFSPEERVFAPYFYFAKLTFPELIGGDHTRALFEKSFTEYSSNSYTNCISTLGLIAEDYLTQVYETLFREVCPKGLTLGQIYDLIHTSIRRAFPEQRKDPPEFKPLYDEIKQIVQKAESDPSAILNKEIAIALRQTVNFLKEEREFHCYLVDCVDKKPASISCFPVYLRDNLIELIKYRNAASHKTRVPIGSYEALRTLYCLISLYMWWNAEKQCIDWEDDQATILKKSIVRNTGGVIV